MISQHQNILIVGLLEGANNLAVNNTTLFYDSDKRVCVTEQLPPGEWELIGLYPGLTEEQAAMCVSSVPHHYSHTKREYKDYTSFKGAISHYLKSAVKSFSTLMDHLKLYTVNPYIKPGPDLYNKDRIMFVRMDGQYQEAQSRTFPLWAVLKKSSGNE